jgi:hypothetical protein
MLLLRQWLNLSLALKQASIKKPLNAAFLLSKLTQALLIQRFKAQPIPNSARALIALAIVST